MSIGGRLLPGTAPAAAETTGEFVVAVGTDQALWSAVNQPGSRGYFWRKLGGRTTANPGIATPAERVVVAFAPGTDNAAWYNQFYGNFTGGVTPGWHSLGGRLTSGVTAIPAMVDQPQGPVYLFGLGTDNQAWMRTGTWPNLHGWTRP